MPYRVTVIAGGQSQDVPGVIAESPQAACDLVAATRASDVPASYTAVEE